MAKVALLATVADLKASQQAGAVSPVMPSGVILPYGGTSAPAGWIECNGQALSETDYPELFAALGSSYNTQLNPATGANWAAPSAGQFRVPDMRGMFMRGEGTPSGLDAVTVGSHQVDKTKKNGLDASGTSVTTSVAGAKNQLNGSIGSSGAHIHRTPAVVGATSTYFYTWIATGTARGADYGFGYGDHQVQSTNSGHTHSFSYSGNFSASGTTGAGTITVGAGDNETRPMNRGVKYIIKT